MLQPLETTRRKKAANISRSDLVIAKTTKIHYNRISFKKSILAPQTITENIVLEIPVDLSQMSALECNNPCQKVKIDRKNILPQEITLTCGEKCEDDSEGDVNSERRCNFLCQWFCVKNDYLIKELAALKEYLNRNTNN